MKTEDKMKGQCVRAIIVRDISKMHVLTQVYRENIRQILRAVNLPQMP